MTHIRSFLHGNVWTFLCLALLTAVILCSWQMLATPLDPRLTAEYAVIEDTALPDRENFRADDLVWHPYSYPTRPPIPEGIHTVCLSWKIPYEPHFLGRNMLFSTANQDVCVYLGSDLVYRYGDWTEHGTVTGRNFHCVHLSDAMAGQRLTLLLHSDQPRWLGTVDYLTFDTTEQFLTSVSLTSATYAAAFSIALAMIAFLAINLSRRTPSDALRRTQIYLIACLAASMLWTAGISSFFPRIVGLPLLWWELHLTMLYVMPITWALLVHEIVAPHYRTQVQKILYALAAAFAAAAVFEMGGKSGYTALLYFYYPFLLAASLGLIYFLARSHWEFHPACRYGTFAVAASTLFCVIDALHWKYHLLSGMLSVTIFSIYAMVPLIFHVIRLQMMEQAAMVRKNEVLAQELAASQSAAQRDFLTGCYNRHQLESGFENFAELARERGFKFSFAIFDIDHFKTINDTRGHLAGDHVLKEIAGIIHDEIDRRHLFIRYGGDEFVLLGLHYDLDAMVAFCDHLRGILEHRLGGVTLSFGVSTWHGADDPLSDLIARADRALYRSKKKGRNTVSAESEIDAA